jgi:outer membrane protein
MSWLKVAGRCAAAMIVASSAVAQQAETTAVKIGWVDVDRAVSSIDEGKARLKELTDWARSRQDELARLGKEGSDLQAEMMAKGSNASEETIAGMNQRLIAIKRELEDRQRVGKRDFDEKQTAVLKDLGGKLQEIIIKFADSNRYTAIFLLRPNELAYLATSADLTDAIIKLYNERHPSAAAASAPSK